MLHVGNLIPSATINKNFSADTLPPRLLGIRLFVGPAAALLQRLMMTMIFGTLR